MQTLSIIHETENWALVFKPHKIPTAPLNENETNTVICWFLKQRPDSKTVSGKKIIEHGLLHRLDTATAGLVLIAKNQPAYDFLLQSQENNLITKHYCAYCSEIPSAAQTGFGNLDDLTLPYIISSRFRPYGPGGKKVKPLFPGMRGYNAAKRDYHTCIESTGFENKESAKQPVRIINCSLARGYRHQIRTHLAFLGYPIIGDRLYNEDNRPDTDLHLFANGISFPDPRSGERVSFLLPIPDKMNQ
ncbi:RNA pseudouridine synthase [Brucepastera parasyntrophica]|uniref:pseudouridine synthase n=1 Tax=Brucepastera parasyntrophica TaxID=2880008 RepID=UPI00210C50D7|nr:pseudouridine synthase [Brucepastera parasyntrophica]ULQ60061.1 RNA pseudouridine synthase [Brucepastera parasyntrophica]